MPFSQTFFKAAIFKLLVTVITTRSLTKIIKSLGHHVPRFGLAISLSTVVFHLAMCVLRRLSKQFRLRIPKSKAAFAAAILCTIPLKLGLQTAELKILKLLLYPLTFRCFVEKLLSLGVIPKIRGGSILSYMIVTYVIAYCYVLEGRSGKSFQKMIDMIGTLRHSPGGNVSFVYP